MKIWWRMKFWLCLLGGMLAVMGAAQAGDIGHVELYDDINARDDLMALPPDRRPIVLQIPEEFRSSASKGAVRAWDTNVLTYYPSFTSMSAPENRQFGMACVGICNGRILISLKNCEHCIHRPDLFDGHDYQNMGDFRANTFLTKKKLEPTSVHDVPLPDGFHEGFGEDISESAKAKDPTAAVEYYFKKTPKGDAYEAAVECETKSGISICELDFSSSCLPGLEITVNGVEKNISINSRTSSKKLISSSARW
jgi:hypothetical protein